MLGYHHHYHHKSHRCMLIAQLNQYCCMWNNDIHHWSHLITDIYRINFKVMAIPIVFQYCGDAVYANATKEINITSLILYYVLNFTMFLEIAMWHWSKLWLNKTLKPYMPLFNLQVRDNICTEYVPGKLNFRYFSSSGACEGWEMALTLRNLFWECLTVTG